ncbi:MAG: signal peptide peptidase SppA [Desulfarculaceae bacterium]|nr:signal peptide peptidase SppA [Desulfarculaceae bacterium]
MKKHPLALAIGVCALIVAVFGGALFVIKPGLRPTAIFGGKVAVVPISGIITQSRPTNELLMRLRRDSSIKAIIIRAESGGGSAAASQEIYREVARTAKYKPVIGSMGGVAASGAYYLLAPCTKIVASPATLTGSIGVIINIPDAHKLMEKIGVNMQTVRAGNLKGAGMISRPLSEAERANLQEMIDQTHRQFIADVARGRHMKYDDVAKLANGGIYTGARAKQLGLVDVMGNFEDAVLLAARLGGIKGEPTLVWPEEKRSWLASLVREQVSLFVKDMMAQGGAAPGLQFLWQPAR